MSKLLNIRLYTEAQWKAASRLERLHIYMIQPQDFTLNQSEEDLLQDLTSIFHILCDHMSLPVAIPMIKSVVFPNRVVSQGTIYRMINQCKELFGNIINRNKAFERNVIRERMLEIYEKMRELALSGDIKAAEQARLALYNIMKLDGIDQHEPGGFDPEDLRLPDLIITSDPQALKAPADE